MVTDLVLCSLVWGLVFGSMWRGYRRTRRLDRYAAMTWMIFVSMALVYTFRVPAVQPAIDAFFDGRPVTFLLSLLAVLAAVAAYSLTLRWLVQRSPEVYPLRRLHIRLIHAAPLVALTLLVLMAAHLTGKVSFFRAQYMMKWLQETYSLLQSAFVFVPINAAMFRQERIFPMRIKHLATLALCATFALSAAFSVLSIPPILVTGEDSRVPYLIPRGQIAACCLGIILVPHRWLALLLLPRRLRCYARLAALERSLAQKVLLRRDPVIWWRMVRPEYVEMAIYVTLINILDHYRRIDPADPVHQQIERLLPLCAGYDDLVEALCNVRG